MQFIKHNPFQRREKIRCVVGRQQQRELFGGREQNIRRIFALALPPRYRRVAGAGLNPHRQLHVGNRPFEIAGDIHRQRLQWRNVERVQATATHDTASGRYCFRGFGLGRAEFHQCRQESRQRIACACRRDQQRRAVAVRFRHQIKLMRARRPAPRRKPALENLGQQIRRCRGLGVHCLEVRRRTVTVEGSGGNSTLPSHLLFLIIG